MNIYLATYSTFAMRGYQWLWHSPTLHKPHLKKLYSEHMANYMEPIEKDEKRFIASTIYSSGKKLNYIARFLDGGRDARGRSGRVYINVLFFYEEFSEEIFKKIISQDALNSVHQTQPILEININDQIPEKPDLTSTQIRQIVAQFSSSLYGVYVTIKNDQMKFSPLPEVPRASSFDTFNSPNIHNRKKESSENNTYESENSSPTNQTGGEFVNNEGYDIHPNWKKYLAILSVIIILFGVGILLLFFKMVNLLLPTDDKTNRINDNHAIQQTTTDPQAVTGNNSNNEEKIDKL